MREVPLTVKRTNKNDMFIKLTVVQLAVCLIIGAVIGAVYKLDRPLFDEMREEFSSLMSGGIDLSSGIPILRRPAETACAPTEDAAEKGGKGTNGETSGKETDTSNDLSAGGIDLNEREAEDCLNFAFYEAGDVPCLPVSGKVTSLFGKRVHPVYGTDGFHSGMDIAAPKGTPILAALDGTVCDTGVGEAAGNYVKLLHDNGLCTLYCHMDRVNTEKGVRIRKGDVIGFVGETGLATGPHLHFEVQRDGEKLDPSFLLDEAVSLG